MSIPMIPTDEFKDFDCFKQLMKDRKCASCFKECIHCHNAKKLFARGGEYIGCFSPDGKIFYAVNIQEMIDEGFIYAFQSIDSMRAYIQYIDSLRNDNEQKHP